MLQGIGLAALLALPRPASAVPAAPRKLAVVVAKTDASKASVVEKIAKATQAHAALVVYELDLAAPLDPIAKGRLLAALETQDLVVAVGDGPTEFVTRELEDSPVYFVGAGVVRGESLESSLVAGIFSYNVDSLLDAAKALRKGTIGLAYTPGYESVAKWVRAGAAQRQLALSERKIAGVKEIVPALRGLLGRARAIWVLGDPLLVRGAGFEFLAEQALSRDIPIIAPGAWEIRHGAFLAYEPPADVLAAQAATAVEAFLREAPGKAALRPAPGGGALLLNAALVERWKISPPEGPAWRLIR